MMAPADSSCLTAEARGGGRMSKMPPSEYRIYKLSEEFGTVLGGREPRPWKPPPLLNPQHHARANYSRHLKMLLANSKNRRFKDCF